MKEAYEKAMATIRVAPDELAEALLDELDTLRHFREFCPSVTGTVMNMHYPQVTVGDMVLTINEDSCLTYKDDWEIGETVTVWHDGHGLAFDSDEKG